jgi:hypothetical protein
MKDNPMTSINIAASDKPAQPGQTNPQNPKPGQQNQQQDNQTNNDKPAQQK